MDLLKGYTIIGGRDPQTKQLLVAVWLGDKYVRGKMGQAGTVPAQVSRCIPEQGSAHFMIEINQQGTIKVSNLKEANVTYINGEAISSKVVKLTDQMELGGARFPVNLVKVLNAAKQIVCQKTGVAFQPIRVPKAAPITPPNPGSKPKEPEVLYDISHLRMVWDRHYETSIAIQKRQKRLGLFGSVSLIFSMFSGALSYIFKGNEALEIILPAMTVCGLIVCVASFIMRARDNSIEEREEDKDWFMDNYVCPNKECRKYFGEMPYRLLRNQFKACPQCKSKYTES